MQKLFITGGAGFIGSETILELLRTDKNREITVYDNFSNGNEKALARIEADQNIQIKVVKGEMLDYESLKSALAADNYDAVIHFAALIEAGKSMTHPTRFFETNVAGSINLIKAMQETNTKKLVFSSTAAVYGTPEEPELYESHEFNPESWYGFTKYVVEELISAINTETSDDSEKIDTVVLRYFNAAGADPEGVLGQDYPNPTHLMTLAIEAAIGKRDKLFINGNDYPTPDGTCIRDYIHVKDLADAHVKALEFVLNRENKYEKNIFNIGTGHGTSNLEVVKALEEIHGDFNWKFGPKRPGDPIAFYANTEKAFEVLGWKAKYSLEDTIKHAYNWHKTYPNGYDDIN